MDEELIQKLQEEASQPTIEDKIEMVHNELLDLREKIDELLVELNKIK